MDRSSRASFNPLDYPLCLSTPRQVDALSWHEHIPFAMALIQLLLPRVIVELGVHTGDSYLAFCQAVAETGAPTRVYGIDTWRGDAHAGVYGQEVLDSLRRHHDPLYGGFSRLVQSTFDEAVVHFADSSIDLLHIDGFHEYQAVAHDWETWRVKLSDRAVVLFHDTNVRERGFGVWRLWEELGSQFPHFEFVHGHGLGVLVVGPDAVGPLNPLLAAARERPATLREFFHRLGSRITLAHQDRSGAAALAEAGRARDELSAAKASLETTLAETSRARDELSAAKASLETTLAETSRARDELSAKMANLEAALAEARASLEARSSECIELRRSIQERDAEIEHLTRGLHESAAQLQALRETVAALTRRADVDRELLATERKTTLDLRKELQAHGAERARLLDKHKLQEERVTELLSSTSWRLTAPLRWIFTRWPALLPDTASPWLRRARLLLRHPLRLRRHRAEIYWLRASGLFDPAFYVSQYPDVGRTGIDPLTHYVVLGAFEGRSPNPLFDSRFYLDANPDVARARANPLLHYLGPGAAAGQAPHPLFDVSFYLERSPDVAESGVNPLWHYLHHGAREGRSPHPLFDPHFYLHEYPDVSRSGLSAFSHYLRYGAAEGRDPHPLFQTSHYLALTPGLREPNALLDYVKHGVREERTPNALFDARSYLAAYPEVVDSGLGSFEHYVRVGAAKGYRPHPLLDRSFYAERYHDVAEAGVEPFVHYLRYGAAERRDPNPLFDTSFYLEHYPDVEADGLNPMIHYYRYGGGEGRDPSALFSTTLYLEENPDVRASGVNALAHFLQGLPPGQDPRETPFAFRSWLAAYGGDDQASLSLMRARLRGLGRCPRVTLIVAVGKGAEPPVLEATVQSVRSQVYEAWELLLALPPATPRVLLDRLSSLAADEPRVRLLRGRSSEPWALLNESVANAAGDFIAFVSDDDLLDSRALLFFAEHLDRHPNAIVVYSDEDQLDHLGRRCNPHFKPDWSPDLFRSWNYLGRLVLIDGKTVRAAGGLRGEFAPSHEYDLLLRVIDAVGADRVEHVPRLLCHRRSTRVAPDGGAHSAMEATSAARALESHLARSGTPGVVEPALGRFHRVLHPLPEEPPLVSIILPTRDRLNLLKPCVDSLLEKTDYQSFEILIIDNESSDPETIAYLRHLPAPHRVLRYEGAFNYSAINNFAARHAAGSVLVFLNNDTEVTSPSWLAEMVRLALRPDVGAVGARLCYPNGTLQHAGVIIGVNGVAGHAFAGLPRCSAGYFGRAALSHEYSAVTSACMAMRRAVFEAVGGFDEQTFPVNFNDIDLCLRVRGVGLKVLYCAQAELVHHESASRRNAAHVEDRIALESDRFRQRWMEVIREDPFYSPNLSLEDGRTFALAVPPRTRDPWAETGLARPPSRTDPYASLDNWTRAVEVETAQRLFTIPDRTWQPGLSIVILTLERFELIAPLLDQLVGARGPLAERGLDLQIVVGDTGSKDERVLRKYADLARQVEVEGSLRYHFSRCNNWLFRQRVIMDKTLFLNNDIVFSDPTASLLALARPLQTQSDIGIVGAALSYPDGRVQHSGIDFYRSGPTRGLPFHPHHGAPAEELSALAEGRDCPAVTGACLAIRSSLFLEMGGFDEAYRTEGQDVALCLEAWRHGHRCHLVPAGRIDHLENGTRPKGSEDWMDRQRLLRRWRAFVETGLC